MLFQFILQRRLGDIKTTSSTQKITIAVWRKLIKDGGQSEPMAKSDDDGKEDRYKQYNNYYDYDDYADYDKTTCFVFFFFKCEQWRRCGSVL